MKELKKLIDVKSIVTLVLTLLVVYQSIMNEFDVRDIYIVIIAFYFGTQSNKKENGKHEN